MSIRLLVVRNGALRNQHHITTLLIFLTRQGFEITFLSLQTDAEEAKWFASEVPNVKVMDVHQSRMLGFKRFLLGGLALRKLARRISFDIIYVINSWTLPYLLFATLGKMKFKKTPLVYHTVDMLVPGVHSKIYLMLEKYTARRSNLNVNVDRSRAEVYKTLYGLTRAPLSVPLRYPLDSVLPPRDEKKRSELLGENANSKFLIVNPTFPFKTRRTREIILAFSYLPQNYYLATIDGCDPYALECKVLAKKMNISDRVRFLPAMTNTEVINLCACADVGTIFHDDTASLGNFLCHPGRLAYYIALGLPVVGNNVPVLESIIYKYKLGACCSPIEPSNIANAINEICEGAIPLSRRRKLIRRAFKENLHYEKEASLITSALYLLVEQQEPLCKF